MLTLTFFLVYSSSLSDCTDIISAYVLPMADVNRYRSPEACGVKYEFHRQGMRNGFPPTMALWHALQPFGNKALRGSIN